MKLRAGTTVDPRRIGKHSEGRPSPTDPGEPLQGRDPDGRDLRHHRTGPAWTRVAPRPIFSGPHGLPDGVRAD